MTSSQYYILNMMLAAQCDSTEPVLMSADTVYSYVSSLRNPEDVEEDLKKMCELGHITEVSERVYTIQ